MKNKSLTCNVPERRFPEFVNDGEWEEKTLSDLSNVGLSNGVFNDPKKVGSGYKLVNVSDMYIESTINEETLSLIELSENEFLKNKVENGDIFFTRSSLVKSGIACSNIYLGTLDNITFDGHLIRFRPNKQVTVPIFMNYLLKTNYIRNQLVARGKTATMTTIGQSDVAEVKLFIPFSIVEQQKIADCLSSIDNLITAQSKKVEALKEHKKGLMQQLFPTDGEKVPKLRFPEFENAPKWKEKPLGSFCSTTTGKLDANAMVENGQYRFYTCAKNYYYINNYAFDTEALLVSGNGANVGYIHHYNGKFNAYQRTYVLDAFSENIIFIKYYLEQSLHKRIATEKKEGNTPCQL